MASVASQLIEEVTAHAQGDSLEDAREICADGPSFPNNLRKISFSCFICLFFYRSVVTYKAENICLSSPYLPLSPTLFCGCVIAYSMFQLCGM